MQRLAALTVTALLLLLVTAACAPAAPAPAAAPTTAAAAPKATDAPKAAAPTTAPAVAPAAAPKATDAPKAAAPAPAAGAGRGKGDQLKILYWQAPTILNPHLSQGSKDYDAAAVALEPLAWIGPDGKPVAALAAEVPTRENGGVAADGKSVTWKLKPGVKWSDGSDFTADDVVFTFNYCANPATACTNAAQTKGVEKVEAVDKNTVKVTFKEATTNPYQTLVARQFMILQKKQFENYQGEKAKDAPGNLKPIGTGPYQVKEFKPGDVVLYDINPNFREADKPFFKEVQIKGGGDATSAARAAFQTGDVDYAWNLQVPWTVLGPLASSPSAKADLVTAVSSNVERVLINFADPNKEIDGARAEPSTRHPFLTDPKVRQALALAIDRKAIADQLYGKTGSATCNIVSGVPELESKNTKCEPDLARAEQLLEEAGWKKGGDGIRTKDGQRLKVVFQTTINPVRQATQDLIKAAWQKIGVETELKSINSTVFFSTDVANPDTGAKFYSDVQMYTNGAEQPDFVNYLNGWTTKEITQKSNEWRGANYHRWSNPDYDKLVETIRAETDATKRRELIIKANDLLVNETVVIPLVARAFPVAGKAKDLKGLVANPWDADLWNLKDWSR